MNKYIVLSVNENPDYLFHVPLTVWAWRKIGWEPIVFYHRKERNPDMKMHRNGLGLLEQATEAGGEFTVKFLDSVPGYKSETIAQVSRLYGSCVVDGYIMTGDIDMIPLSDYWKPDFDNLTVWGRDLTDYHYPICYIGAHSELWREIMGIPGINVTRENHYDRLIKRDLRQQKNMWTLDQDLITERINNSGIVPTRIDRGRDKRTGYPIGRIDRSNWTLDHQQYIDAHLFHDVHRNDQSFKKTLEMLHHVWPKENWNWWLQYVKEFKKLYQNTQSVV